MTLALLNPPRPVSPSPPPQNPPKTGVRARREALQPKKMAEEASPPPPPPGEAPGEAPGPGGTTLRALLERYGVPETLTAGMSGRWRAEEAPFAPTPAAQARALGAGAPFLAPEAHAARVCGRAGPDGLEYVRRASWDGFKKPRIAMIGGWGRPGTAMLGDDHLALVGSFSEVLARPEPLNLQLFHRADVTSDLPRLAEELEWPLPEVLRGPRGELGAPCDVATRVSRRGATTWWHLDDGGEFVFQVGLPLAPASLRAPGAVGPGGKPVVKLFVFLPKAWYDLAMQDHEMNKNKKFYCLDIFNTASEHLPGDAADGGAGLPTVRVAALEAGGRPLLSVPNVPHLVITLQDCVMVEQRMIMATYLDEVASFLRRAERWSEAPIIYPFIREDLKDPAAVRRRVAEPLLEALGEGPGTGPVQGLRFARAAAALRALVAHPAFFRAEAALAAEVEQRLAEAGPAAAADEGGDRAEALARAEWPGGHRFPGGRYAAYVHERGTPKWGPMRVAALQAKKDRKALLAARKAGRLGEALAELRRGADEGEVGGQ